MSKPLEHAQNSVKKHGGSVGDYLPIHELIDSSKAALGDKRHRAATHNTWFIYTILPEVFGSTIKNTDGVDISVTQIGEDHVLEDYGDKFVPTLSDFLSELPLLAWMDNGREYPPSSKGAIVTSPKDQHGHQTAHPIFDDIVMDGANKYRQAFLEKSNIDTYTLNPSIASD